MYTSSHAHFSQHSALLRTLHIWLKIRMSSGHLCASETIFITSSHGFAWCLTVYLFILLYTTSTASAYTQLDSQMEALLRGFADRLVEWLTTHTPQYQELPNTRWPDVCGKDVHTVIFTRTLSFRRMSIRQTSESQKKSSVQRLKHGARVLTLDKTSGFEPLLGGCVLCSSWNDHQQCCCVVSQ